MSKFLTIVIRFLALIVAVGLAAKIILPMIGGKPSQVPVTSSTPTYSRDDVRSSPCWEQCYIKCKERRDIYSDPALQDCVKGCVLVKDFANSDPGRCSPYGRRAGYIPEASEGSELKKSEYILVEPDRTLIIIPPKSSDELGHRREEIWK